MLFSDFQSPSDVTDEQALYLAGLAKNLSIQDDFAIKNYADGTITSPNAQQALQTQSAMEVLGDEIPDGAASDIFSPSGAAVESLSLSDYQQDFMLDGLWDKTKSLFSDLRRKVQRVFCKVVNALGSDKDLDLKSIIKNVLIALVPTLAASAGLMPIALPIVVSLAAMLLKYGVSKVCPV